MVSEPNFSQEESSADYSQPATLLLGWDSLSLKSETNLFVSWWFRVTPAWG